MFSYLKKKGLSSAALIPLIHESGGRGMGGGIAGLSLMVYIQSQIYTGG